MRSTMLNIFPDMHLLLRYLLVVVEAADEKIRRNPPVDVEGKELRPVQATLAQRRSALYPVLGGVSYRSYIHRGRES